MRYVSTRGESPSVGWEDAISSGYAPDGGLYVPVDVPKVSQDMLEEVSDFTTTSQTRT